MRLAWAARGDTAPKVERRKGKEKRREEGKDTGTEGHRKTKLTRAQRS